MHDIYATAYHPPDLEMLRRYNVNRGMAGLGAARGGRRRSGERAALRTMTPEQRKAELAAREKVRAAREKVRAATRRYQELSALVKKPYSDAPLTDDEKIIQKMVLARDWDALFTLLPPIWWGRQTGNAAGSPAKYSWRLIERIQYPPGYLSRASAARRSRRRVQINGGFEPLRPAELKALPKKMVRVFRPWSRDDISRWTHSKWYTIQPGWTCSPEQREQGIAFYMEYTRKWRAANPDTKWSHVFPFYPGGGARKQAFGCVKPKKTLWQKIRKPLAIAVGVVAAVWLGPIVLGKIVGAGAAEAAGGAAAAGASAGGSAAATAGIVGAGAKAGAVAAITTKSAVAAALTTKATISGAAMLATVKTAASAATIISSAAEAGTLFSRVQNVTTWVNRARSVDAIIKGELPPPPIGISGGNFTEWAMALAKDEIKKEIGERAGEYISKRAQEKYEKEQDAMMRAEIEKMQAELAALVSAQTPIAPAPEIDNPAVRDKLVQMQDIEKKRAQQTMVMLAVGGGAAMLMLG